jgi:ubiquinone biosynthesis protein
MILGAVFSPFASLLGFFGVLMGALAAGLIARRLLGIKQSWLTRLVVGFLGFFVGVTFALTIGAEHLDTPEHILVFSASILVSLMLFTVVFELLARAGEARAVRQRGTGIPHPIQAIRRRLARWARYLQITSILARYGLSPYFRGSSRFSSGQIDGSPGSRRLWGRVRGALGESGGAFVKLGQVLSTRSDILPLEAIAELAGLQDRVPTAPRAAVEVLLAEELGAPLSTVFAAFEHEPLAAASIAQVYRARLSTGEQVVVKVQRPGIREPVERDLDILLSMSRTLEARAAWARAFGVVDLAEGFANALREELDFRVEARNTTTVAAALEKPGVGGGQSEVRIPRVFAQLSTRRMLVLEWLDGVSVRDAGALIEELSLERAALARALLFCFLRQLLRDGTFHADPHPGNVMVLRDGRLALLDFGSVGRLDPLQQAALKRMLVAIERRDAAMLGDALLDLAQERPGADQARLERALAQVMAQRLGPGMEPGPELFKDLFTILFNFGLSFQPVIGGVFRALVTLQGTLGVLAPGFQLMQEARALGSEWMQEAITPSSVRKAVTDEVLTLFPILQRLPRRLDRISAAVEHGTLSVNVRLLADERDARLISKLVSWAVLAFLGAALGMISVLLLGIKGGPAFSDTIGVYQLFGYFGLFISVVLILRVVTAIVRERLG